MIHTIIDLNDVFADRDEYDLSTELTDIGYKEYITINGEKHLHRLFSTRPQDFLKL